MAAISRRAMLFGASVGIGTFALRERCSAFQETCIQTVPGTPLTYYLVALDKLGRERPWSDGRHCSEKAVEQLTRSPVTDVFIFSHGWMGDVLLAKDQYARWIKAMADCRGDIDTMRRLMPGFEPLLIGIHWPSLPYGDEELRAALVAPNNQREVNQFADRIVDTPRSRQALQTILAVSNQPMPERLPRNLVNAFKVLQQEAGLQTRGIAGPPGADAEKFDPGEIYQGIKTDFEVQGHAAAADASGDFKYNLLYMLALVSFWTMKDRAKIVGENGGRRLLRTLQSAVPTDRDVKFHLAGHSFGCIVTSAMLRGANGDRTPIRPISSLSLIQGALSLWSYTSNVYGTGTPGYFRPIIDRRMVLGPIVSTQSHNDTAVRVLYPYAAGIARQRAMAGGPTSSLPEYGGVGTFGIQGSDCRPNEIEILRPHQFYGFEPGQIYNVESTRVIKTMSPVSGAHSDIAHPEVGHLVWQAASCLSEPSPTPHPAPPSPLPAPPPSSPPRPVGPLRRFFRRR